MLCHIVYGDTKFNKMKNVLLYCLLVFVLYSCGISKYNNKAINTAFSSTVITQMAMAKILVESATSIYQSDSLKADMPIYIQSLEASFKSKLDTFKLVIDSIKATWINDTTIIFKKVDFKDSVNYKQVIIPSYSSYLGTDTLDVSVICKYLPNMDFVINKDSYKCLTADYVIKEQVITIKNEFKKCSVSTLRE